MIPSVTANQIPIPVALELHLQTCSKVSDLFRCGQFAFACSSGFGILQSNSPFLALSLHVFSSLMSPHPHPTWTTWNLSLDGQEA